MTIPFEQIGPNQVGRLVYQVIGKEGPIFNPKNIKYLPPSDATIHANLPDNFFKNKAQDDVFSEIISLSTVWLWNNDGGLIFRAQQELLALNEGYDNIFWFKLLDQEDSPIKEIFSSCSYSA